MSASRCCIRDLISMQALIFCCVLLLGTVSGSPSPSYIVGGHDVPSLGKWPSVCSLQYNWPRSGWGHYCTSAILSKDWIVTAAHCVISNPPSVYQVRCGSLEPNVAPENQTDIQIRAVSEIIINEDYEYDYRAYPNDIALIHLAEPLDLAWNIWPSNVGWNDDYDWSFSTCYSVGWGDHGKCWNKNNFCDQWAKDGHCTKSRSEMEWKCPISCGMCNDVGRKKYLQEAQTWALNYPGCVNKWSFNQITKDHICAYDYLNQLHGSCNGDSGGPFFCMRDNSWFQVGVFSYMASDCTPHKPSVYTRIMHYLDWINTHTDLEL